MSPKSTLPDLSLNPFAVFFRAADDKSGARQMALIKSYSEKKLGEDIQVVAETVFTQNMIWSALLLVRAADKQTLENALAAYTAHFYVEVSPLSQLDGSGDETTANYITIVWNETDDTPAAISDTAQYLRGLTVVASATFAANGPIKQLWFIQAASATQCRRYGHLHSPGSRVQVTEAETPAAFLATEMAYSQKLATGKKTTEALQVAAASSPCTMTNNTSGTVYITQTSEQSFAGKFMGTQSIAKGDSLAVTSNYYLFIAPGELLIDYWDSTPSVPPLPPVLTPKTYGTHYPNPNFTGFAVPGANLLVTFGNGNAVEVNVQTTLSQDLNNIFTTGTYNQHWPERAYKRKTDNHTAYEYILGQLNLGSKKKPVYKFLKKETDPSVAQGIYNTINGLQNPYTAGSSLYTSFATVQSQLMEECTCFENSAGWYQAYEIIYSNTFGQASDALSSAISNMELPKGGSSTEVIVVMNDIISVLTNIISIIPESSGFAYGAEVGAFLFSGQSIWDEGSGSGSKPIQCTAAELYTNLSKSWSQYLGTLGTQLEIINKDWGRLSTFSSWINDQTINFPPWSTACGDAATNAFSLQFYQALFAAAYAPVCTMNASQTAPTNPWDPGSGNYDFTYYIPGTYTRCSKNYTGYIIFECSTNAPAQALKALFDSGGVGANPIEFFLGISGWPTVTPTVPKLDVPPVSFD